MRIEVNPTMIIHPENPYPSFCVRIGEDDIYFKVVNRKIIQMEKKTTESEEWFHNGENRKYLTIDDIIACYNRHDFLIISRDLTGIKHKITAIVEYEGCRYQVSWMEEITGCIIFYGQPCLPMEKRKVKKIQWIEV
jgi:hypothetical protein